MSLLVIGEKLISKYVEQEGMSPRQVYFLDVSSRLALSLSCERLLCNRRRIQLLLYYLKGYRLYYTGLRDEQTVSADSVIHDAGFTVMSEEQLQEEYNPTKMIRDHAQDKINTITSNMEGLLLRQPFETPEEELYVSVDPDPSHALVYEQLVGFYTCNLRGLSDEDLLAVLPAGFHFEGALFAGFIGTAKAWDKSRVVDVGRSL